GGLRAAARVARAAGARGAAAAPGWLAVAPQSGVHPPGGRGRRAARGAAGDGRGEPGPERRGQPRPCRAPAPPRAAAGALPGPPPRPAPPPRGGRGPALPGPRPGGSGGMSALRPSACVFAGAGTGKTHGLITECLGLLAGAHREEPLQPAALCLLTFTEKAAAEMRGRLAARVDALAGGRGGEPELEAALAAAGRPIPGTADWRRGGARAPPAGPPPLPPLLPPPPPPAPPAAGPP